MALFDSHSGPLISRRRFLKTSIGGAAGLALYSSGIERHWIEVVQREIHLPGLAGSFNGLRIAQLSDIHMDQYTEPIFLRHVIDRVNRMQPDLVLLTGDFISYGLATTDFEVGAAWQCANLLTGLECRQLYAVLGNHDVTVDAQQVTAALTSNGISVLTNACVPIERAGGRIWLTGVDDPVMGLPDPEKAIPAAIRNVPNEPVILMCHAPDYVDYLLAHPVGKAIDLVLSGHTHGGQIRLPLVGALQLPEFGKKYVEGWFRLGAMQLYVN
ncbi:MAG TPA: metallophosphoesterase, partial [Terracidiphilus sp.]|nr:metallophosphoesterase [Terracidiphilus sp.]